MTQNSQILKFLRAGKSLTPLLALERFSCLRLSARILELRSQGHPIHSRLAKLGRKHVSVYRLA